MATMVCILIQSVARTWLIKRLSFAYSDLEGIEPIGEPEFQDIYTTPEQLGEELLTLSLMPRSRWQTLLNLDIIRVSRKRMSTEARII